MLDYRNKYTVDLVWGDTCTVDLRDVHSIPLVLLLGCRNHLFSSPRDVRRRGIAHRSVEVLGDCVETFLATEVEGVEAGLLGAQLVCPLQVGSLTKWHRGRHRTWT